MSNDGYTPDTSEVRIKYKLASGVGDAGFDEFDRWLAQHDAEITKHLRTLARDAIIAHRNLHPVYGSTSACHGGAGGQTITIHCADVCENPVHDDVKDAWQDVEQRYFAHTHSIAAKNSEATPHEKGNDPR